MAPPEILYADNHCLVLAKPARMLTVADHSGDACLLKWGKEWIRCQTQKPGNVFLEAAHRIDRPVSGIVLCARTSKAASRLTKAFRDRAVEKLYLAVVEGIPPAPSGECHDLLLKDQARNVSQVVQAHPDAKPCLLTWKLLESRQGRSLLLVRPETGRPHQIRVQLSSRGWPIVGDVKYGSKEEHPSIALHAAGLSFPHPTKSELVTVTSHPPWAAEGHELFSLREFLPAAKRALETFAAEQTARRAPSV